jgi:hypothetical protein
VTYPFVQAAFDYGPMKVAPVGFVIHMAEGGGTVGYLSRSPARGVSVHYVIEYSGQIVQMLRENRCSGSINPATIRTSDDPDGFYGATSAKAVMGTHWKDPNAACLSLEIEGFASAGPNGKQSASLVVLTDDIRSRHPSIGLLGHRDFTTEKACPGKHIPWTLLGGHGPASGQSAGGNQPAGDEMGEFIVPLTPAQFTITGSTRSFGGDPPHDELSAISGTVTVDATVSINATTSPHGPFVRVVTGTTGRRLIASTSGTFDAPAPPAADCTQAVSDAVAAEHERVRTAAIAAIEGL